MIALGIFAASYGEGNAHLASFRPPGETILDSERAARSRGTNVLYLGSERNTSCKRCFWNFAFDRGHSVFEMVSNAEDDIIAKAEVWNRFGYIAGFFTYLESTASIFRITQVDRDRDEFHIVDRIIVPVKLHPATCNHSVDPAGEASDWPASCNAPNQPEQLRIVHQKMQDTPEGVIQKRKVVPELGIFSGLEAGAAQVTLNDPEQLGFDEPR